MMKNAAIALLALVALAGCDRFGGAGSANSTNNVSAAGAMRDFGRSQNSPQTASADGKPAAPDSGSQPQGGTAPPASDQGSVQLDRAFMVGRWGEDRACTQVTILAQDGRLTAITGGQGQWDLQGSQLTISSPGGAPHMLQLSPIDHNTVTVTLPDGSVGRWLRC